MNTVEKKYLPHLHETHAHVRVDGHLVKIVECHTSGLISTKLLTGARKGSVSAHDTAVRLYKKAAAS